jgi:tetratricopeptide (TPR) repeat protein
MQMRWLGSWLFGKLRSPRCFLETARVLRAARREDWAAVVAGLDHVREQRPLDGLELGYLGAALLRLERYEEIVAEFTRLQKRSDAPGLEALRPYFASALLWLERNQEALEQFEKMGGDDDATRTHRALRHWNHAIALYRLGRTHEARKLLMDCIDDAWPRPEFDQALRLLRSMGIEAH